MMTSESEKKETAAQSNFQTDMQQNWESAFQALCGYGAGRCSVRRWDQQCKYCISWSAPLTVSLPLQRQPCDYTAGTKLRHLLWRNLTHSPGKINADLGRKQIRITNKRGKQPHPGCLEKLAPIFTREYEKTTKNHQTGRTAVVWLWNHWRT